MGNSKGIRIPKAILEQCGLKKQATMTVVNNSLVITSCEEPREGWAHAFQLMAYNKDDVLWNKAFQSFACENVEADDNVSAV